MLDRPRRFRVAVVAAATSIVLAAPAVVARATTPTVASVGAQPAGLQPAIIRLGGPGTVVTSASRPLASTPATATGIGPGSKLIITRPDGTYACTANFVWRSGTATLLGAAGHCFLPAGKVATAGPGADYDASAVRVSVCTAGCSFGGQTGFIVTGTLVPLGAVAYARQSTAGQDIGNDFGLVSVPAGATSALRPSLPVWGGPTVAGGADTVGATLCHYGNGVAVGETFPTMARAGLGMGTRGGAWYGELAASPGDSGSAVETCGPTSSGLHGIGAVGILTHLTAGTSITAGTTVDRAIQMATEARLAISLVTGS